MMLVVPLLSGAADPLTDFENRIVAVHNVERAKLGIAPLYWDVGLAASAKSWADHLAATGAFEHAPESDAAPEGENLWEGSKGYFSLEAQLDGWVREKHNFKQGTFPDNSTTGNVTDVGHYTQLIWRQTKKVGCAEATGWRNDILVCRYSDAGNYLGEKPF